MKNHLLFFIFISFASTVFSQTGVSDINFTPQSMLHVHLNAVSGNLLQLTNTTTGNGSNIVGFKLNYSGNDLNFINNQVGFMSFYTSNSERMRILSDGNVGIGSTAPLERLRVAGRTFLDPQPGFTGNNAKITLAFGDDDSGINWGGDGVLDFYSQNTPIGRMKYYSGNEESFSFGTTATSNTDQVIIQSSGTTSANFGLKVKNSVGTDQFVVRSDGNIGIGITGPLAQLHTTGTVRFGNYPSGVNGAILKTNSNGDLSITNFSGNATDVLLGNNTFGTIASAGGVTTSCGTINYVPKMTTANNIGCSQIFDDGTNVGIGTVGPTHKLTIQSSTISTLRLIGPGSWGSTARLNFGDGNYVYIDEDLDDNLTIYGSTRTAIMGGNVGIGTTGPGYKLHVLGDIYANGGWFRVSGSQGIYWESYGGGWNMQDGTYIRGYGNKTIYNTCSVWPAVALFSQNCSYYGAEIYSCNNWDQPGLYVGGYVAAYDYYNISTRKVKKDIIPLTSDDNNSALNFVVKDLNFVYYRFKENPSKIELGLIAEETPEVLVAPGYQAVDYGKISVYNSSAIKALNAKVEKLEELTGLAMNKKSVVINDFDSGILQSNEMWINFSDNFSSMLNENVNAVITVTASMPGYNIYVIEKSKKGFKISCPEFSSKNISFDWVAMAKILVEGKEILDESKNMNYSAKFTQMLKEGKEYIKNAPIPKTTLGEKKLSE